MARFQLLQHRRDIAAGENISRKQENRQAVDGCPRCCGYHVVAPGPIEVVQAKVCSRFFIFAKAAAVCTIACSLRLR